MISHIFTRIHLNLSLNIKGEKMPSRERIEWLGMTTYTENDLHMECMPSLMGTQYYLRQ